MNWAHLPVAGGLYDQDPALLEQFTAIFLAQHQYEEEKRAKEERERNKRGRRNFNVRN